MTVSTTALANTGIQLTTDAAGNPLGIAGANGTILIHQKRKRNGPAVMFGMLPSQTLAAQTGTASLMLTAPGDFDAVAAVAINYDTTAPMVIDNLAFAVSERSDTSKTVPVISGVSYNALAGANDQLGFVPGTWGGAAAASVPVATLAASGSGKVIPNFLMSDFTPLSSIPRVDNPNAFPLVICRQFSNNRTQSVFGFPTAADVDALNTLMAPYEFYQVNQGTVNGATTPSAFTTNWALGASTQNMRICALAFRLRGTSEFIMWTGDSLDQGACANGDLNVNKPANNWSGFAALTAKSLASKTRPVGYMNLAWSGTRSADYLEVVKRGITALRPSISVYPVSSPNDSPNTVAAMSAEMARALDFIDTCEQNNVVPVLRVPTPYSGFTEATRRAFIAKIKAIRQVLIVDVDAPVYDASNAAQNYWAATAYFDGVHPNAAGHVAMANNGTIPFFKSLLGS